MGNQVHKSFRSGHDLRPNQSRQSIARQKCGAQLTLTVLVPEDGKLAFAIHGDLAGTLALASHGKSPADAEMLVQMKLVAGAASEPATFRS